MQELPKVEAVIKEAGKPKFVVLGYNDFRKLIRRVPLSGRIDEQDYLRRYPDVAKAIAERKFASATEHYMKAGYVEQRTAKILQSKP